MNDQPYNQLIYQKTTFHTREAVIRYIKKTESYPVVKKRKADSGNAKDDYFELVQSFPSLLDARGFIATRLNCLIWYVPTAIR